MWSGERRAPRSTVDTRSSAARSGFAFDSGIYTARLTLEPKLSDVVHRGIDTFEANLYDCTSLPGGRRMIVRTPTSEHGASELRLVLNWQAEVERLVPDAAR